jgi:hypothetical protein
MRASTRLQNHSRLSSSSRSLPLKLSTKPFCHGLPGAMKAGPATARPPAGDIQA